MCMARNAIESIQCISDISSPYIFSQIVSKHSPFTSLQIFARFTPRPARIQSWSNKTFDKEHVNPVLSSSTLTLLTTPSSTTNENLFARSFPNNGVASNTNPICLNHSPVGSANIRTFPSAPTDSPQAAITKASFTDTQEMESIPLEPGVKAPGTPKMMWRPAEKRVEVESWFPGLDSWRVPEGSLVPSVMTDIVCVCN
ncbi:hypothetical protein G7K_6815-t1 [Saitoella complicata NRRL Y-17804]|uniref:Uncharacterized protein n=1 Tax=Saitoella complicata (strain BCRC 22490 / CBS 7301 / JCM 7358 / NBRC 10748 / NRRL Y-17804) TaxID=698492 RepID=A0A0E9NSU3_SAICN|nr:hypothetical protein G7K_6815-t1 [Saitoella complicata NRRL Y-17804]